MGREVQEHLFVVEEPGSVLPAGVGAVHGEVPDPVDIGGGGQPAVDGMDGEVFRVDFHPALEGRGGDQFLRDEGDGIGFPAGEGQAVHQAVVIEEVAGGTGRGGDADVEHGNDVPVEVHPEGGGAGELAEDVLLVQAGDAAGLENFLVHGGFPAVVPVEDRFGEQDRDVAVEGRGVLHVRDQFAPLAEDGLADDVVHIGEGELHLAVDIGLPGVPAFRVMFRAAGLQVVQDGTELQLFPLAAEDHAVRGQLEVHFRVGPCLDREGKHLVADDRGADLGNVFLFGGLDVVGAGGIGIDAGHGPVEENRGIGDALAGPGIRHLSPDPGRLGKEPDRGQEQDDKRYEPVFRHNLPNIRIIWQILKRTSCTGGPAARVWPFRGGCGRARRRRRSRSGESPGRPCACGGAACRRPCR